MREENGFGNRVLRKDKAMRMSGNVVLSVHIESYMRRELEQNGVSRG